MASPAVQTKSSGTSNAANLIEWRIYYSDGTTFSSADGPWADAPRYMIICVATLDPTGVWGRFVLQNHEIFYSVPGREVMCSEILQNVYLHTKDELAWPADYLNVPRDELPTEIKFGGNAWQLDWNKILIRATHDIDFPRSSPRRRSMDWPEDDPRAPSFTRRTSA